MFGPGVERSGLKAHEPTHFTVDCTEAGEGERGLHPTQCLLFLGEGSSLCNVSWVMNFEPGDINPPE